MLLLSKLYTPAETAEILGISPKTLASHIKAGRIRFVKIGTGVKRMKRGFCEMSISKFIASQKVRETPACPSLNTPIPLTTKYSSNSTVVPFAALPKPPTRKKQKP